MPVKYTMCESDVLNRIGRVMQKHHEDPFKEKVVIDAVFAFDEDGAAIKLHGYPCAATIKKVGYKQRVLGRGDAELTIDKEYWENASETERDALIDHELTHLVLVIDSKNGKVKKDKADRPRLGMRLHDWQLGGFAETARRYGRAAPEVIVAREFKQHFGQLCFEFANKSAA